MVISWGLLHQVWEYNSYTVKWTHLNSFQTISTSWTGWDGSLYLLVIMFSFFRSPFKNTLISSSGDVEHNERSNLALNMSEGIFFSQVKLKSLKDSLCLLTDQGASLTLRILRSCMCALTSLLPSPNQFLFSRLFPLPLSSPSHLLTYASPLSRSHSLLLSAKTCSACLTCSWGEIITAVLLSHSLNILWMMGIVLMNISLSGCHGSVCRL